METNVAKTDIKSPNIFSCNIHVKKSYRKVFIVGSSSLHSNLLKALKDLHLLFSIYNKNAYIYQLEDCSNGIDRCHQDNTWRYKGHAIPETCQAVQESIYVGHAWEHFCRFISDNSPKCWSGKDTARKLV